MYSKVTMIDDLPKLDDIENKFPDRQDARIYQKFIRNSGVSTPQEAGMGAKQLPQSLPQHQQLPQQQHHPLQQQYQQPFNQQSEGSPVMFYPPNYNPYMGDISENYQHIGSPQSSTSFDINNVPSNCCIGVANHTSTCPVCSRLYNNNDWIGIAIIISIQLLILLLMLRTHFPTSR